MQDLKIAVLQTPLFWEDPEANRKMLEQKFGMLSTSPDLIILPEMFNTGFTVEPESFAETADGPTLAWMHEQALNKSCAIAGSLIIKDQEAYFNRFYFVHPDGSSSFYDKRHLFRMSGEHKRFSQGSQRTIIHYKGWKIKPMVCYDLRFPVWSKNSLLDGQHEYDTLIYVANWPAARANIWKSLLISRAIENQAYVIGVNRIGKDGKQVEYTGDSMILDPEGSIMAQVPAGEEKTMSFTLTAVQLKNIREAFRVGLDWDQFSIDIQGNIK